MGFHRRTYAAAAVALCTLAGLSLWAGQNLAPVAWTHSFQSYDRSVPSSATSQPHPQPSLNTAAPRPLQSQLAVPYESSGYSDVYDIYVGNVDRSRPIGALFYFTGDVDYESDAKYYDASFISEMTDFAATHNLAFIAVHTPSAPTDPLDYFNWWDTPAKGDFARDLVRSALASYQIDRNHVWLTGYSGGAEMVMSELMAHDVDWLSGGGAIVMGGGDAVSGVDVPQTDQIANLPLLWVVGEDDGEPIPDELDWSARFAATKGYQEYLQAGFTNAQIELLPDQDHSYDIAAVIETGLTQLDPQSDQ